MYHLLLGLEMSWHKGLTSIIGGSITAPSPSKENELLELKGRKSTLLILDSTRRAPCGGGLKTTWPWSNLNDALFSTLLRELNYLNMIIIFCDIHTSIYLRNMFAEESFGS